MHKLAIAIHGGAGPDSDYIKQNYDEYKRCLQEITDNAYRLLKDGATAVDAVEFAVKQMEDEPLFNAGKGTSLNKKREIEMCCSIMSGKDRKSGAAAIVKNVKNPISLARAIMEKTKYTYLGDSGALEFAQEHQLELRPEEYFITDHALEDWRKAQEQDKNERRHGTVGAVALDREGNIAAATSTGGLEDAISGRIADSSMIGVGSYADNATCAVSGTGDGEYLIQNVISFHMSVLMEYKGMDVKQAAHYLLHEKLKDIEGDIGLIAVDVKGNIALEFNSERMHRGWKTSDSEVSVAIYR